MIAYHPEIMNSPAAIFLLALFALAMGSLLNVIIYRLPLMLRANWIKEYPNPNLAQLTEGFNTSINLFFPRSFCPSCKTTISAKHNIPILSYCLLRGRCNKCKQPISLRYPLVEILSCLLSLYCAWNVSLSLDLLFILLFVWILIALFFIDLEQQLLPDSLTLGLLWLGLFANTQSLFTSLPDAVFGAAAAYLALWFFIKLFYLLSGKVGMGNGDFKLFAAFGAWFGWPQLLLILLLASLIGAITGIIYLQVAGKTKDTPIPFGPFLCLAGFISLFWGNALVDWWIYNH
jgi:leader peptidase (prepilin peptidase) / N-methyltransferase